MYNRFKLLPLAAALAFAANAHAADVAIKEVNLGTGQSTSGITLPLGSGTWWTGFQNISVSSDLTPAHTPASSFAAFCVDPAHYSSTAWNVFTTNTVASAFGSKATDINNLFSHFYASTISNSNNAAAFQLALWEIANDTGKNLSTNAIQYSGATGAGSGAFGEMVAKMITDTGWASAQSYSLTVYKAKVDVTGVRGAGQDYIVAAPVPEPETYALMLAGLGLMGMIARRKGAV